MAQTFDCQVVVVGGGMVGLTTGIALASAGIEVTVLDRADPDDLLRQEHDGRASAIARGSKQLLEAIGVWPRMATSAAPIREIRVSDGRVGRPASPFFLHYDQDDLDGQPLGYIVENLATRKALYHHASTIATLRLIAPVDLKGLARNDHEVTARLGDGSKLRAGLVIAADGAPSQLRQEAGIQVARVRYPQVGIVCSVTHEQPHNGVAHEHFLPSGPFAVLPMTDTPDGRHRSSIVWTERATLAPSMLALGEKDFSQEMTRRFGESLGPLRLMGRRWSYPLVLQHARTYHAARLALVGDAAHVIHPIAGQGLNLGLKDVAALAEVLCDAVKIGLDCGSTEVLRRYERWRRVDNMTLVAATDGLNRLFSNDLGPLRLLRDLGLAGVHRVPPLKRLFMQHAMGLLGDLPPLLEGRRWGARADSSGRRATV